MLKHYIAPLLFHVSQIDQSTPQEICYNRQVKLNANGGGLIIGGTNLFLGTWYLIWGNFMCALSVIQDGISTVGLALNCKVLLDITWHHCNWKPRHLTYASFVLCSLNRISNIVEHISCTICLISNLNYHYLAPLMDRWLGWHQYGVGGLLSKRIVCHI